MKHLTALIFSVFTLLLAACTGGDIGSSTTGKLSVAITDAPVDDANAVVIHYTKATIKPEDGDLIEIDITNPDDGTPGHSINLLELTGEKSTVLFSQEIPAGNYSWIRLDIDLDPVSLKSYIELKDGSQYPLSCNSCANTGLKLNRSFDVTTDNTMAFTLDFDLRKSITAIPSSDAYQLRPTIRIIETDAAGIISGTIDGTLISLIDVPDGAGDCVVYIYEGSDITPNDIFIPESGSTPPGFNNPISTATVELNDQAVYEYTGAYLPAGEYTVSLTCDADLDNPLEMNNADVNFTGTSNATVTAGETEIVDFNAP